MNVADILRLLRDRGATLYVEAGRLKYRGPKRLADDPLRAAIAENRDELLAMFSLAQPVIRPVGWSERLGREVYHAGPRPGTWVETADSAMRCIWCPELLVEGDKLGCEQHRTPNLIAMSTAAAQTAGAAEHLEGAA